jgi:kinetochore protein Spc7/SPC105
MANRRVSFAPEATLHTWNVVELGEDSTSSSASNSTRRASSLTNSQAPSHGSDHSEAPSTPDREEDPDAAFSPVQHEGLHEQSGDLSSSPFSGSSVGGSEETGTHSVRDAEGESESDNDFDGESTAMSLDDVTSRTNATSNSDNSSTSSNTRLNEALRQAAQAAGTRGIDLDEDADMSMEIADQEITGAFQPWIKKRISLDMEDLSALQDQENINPFQLQEQNDNNGDGEYDDNDYEELSMDITNAVGRILGKNPTFNQSAGRRKSTGEETSYDEKTMEFTNVVGGIAARQSPAKSDADSNVNEDEEMTMEFTSVVGGVLSKPPSGSESPDRNMSNDVFQQQTNTGRNFSEWGTDEDDAEEMDMEFTGAVGGILPPIEERTEPQDDQTAGMDITTAMGSILPPGLGTDNRRQAKEIMELETDAGQLASSPFQERVPLSPPKLPGSHHIAPVASESGSPSLASVRSRRTRRSSERRASTTPSSSSRQTTPPRKPSTPSKQLTPQPLRPSTPGKTPPSSNITFRSASPKKLFREEIRMSATRSRSPAHGSLFENDAKTGESTPSVILRPHPRRSSGLGIDKEGLGSPLVAAMLDRRRSIGEDAQDFVPQEQPPRRLRFEDPVKMQEEVDRERAEEEQREDGHIPALQLNDRDVTSNLKELISSLTPKKKVGGRKSLHVGAAKGLLGKRPVELDEDDDEEDNSPKRLRGRNASPVKNVKLPAPPSKEETVGRRTRFSTNKLFQSPEKSGSFTPKEQKPAREVVSPSKGKGDAEEPPAAPSVDADIEEAEDVEPEWEPIQLQDFLNLTNIHFMELTTTKRRHTTAPGSDQKALGNTGDRDSGKAISLEDCVAAGFCTVPMLELYQHVSSILIHLLQLTHSLTVAVLS